MEKWEFEKSVGGTCCLSTQRICYVQWRSFIKRDPWKAVDLDHSTQPFAKSPLSSCFLFCVFVPSLGVIESLSKKKAVKSYRLFSDFGFWPLSMKLTSSPQRTGCISFFKQNLTLFLFYLGFLGSKLHLSKIAMGLSLKMLWRSGETIPPAFSRLQASTQLGLTLLTLMASEFFQLFPPGSS